MNKQKICFILRGLPGAGKSTAAAAIDSLCDPENKGLHVFEADQYFVQPDGKYYFRPEELPLAHEFCRTGFEDALSSGLSPVVLSNVSATNGDFSHYRNAALRAGYIVFSLIVENRHDGKPKNEIPRDIIDGMEEKFDIRLLPDRSSAHKRPIPELIHKYARLQFLPVDIALYLDIDQDTAEQNFSDPGHEWSRAYLAGQMEAEIEHRKSVFMMAGRGSTPAQKMALDMINSRKSRERSVLEGLEHDNAG